MEPQKKEDKKLIDKGLQGIRAYMDATESVRAERAEDFRFNQGDQWSAQDREKLKRDKRPMLKFNVIGTNTNFIAGYQQEREQDFRAYPRGSEDEYLGRLATALMKYAMDTCRGMHMLHKGFRQGIIGGQSVFEVSHSYDLTDDILEGDSSIEVLEHDTWGHEIGARRYDRNDATYQFKLMFMDIDTAVRKWKDKEKELRYGFKKDWLRDDPTLTGVPDQLLDSFIDEQNDRIRVCQYWYRVPVTVALLVNLSDGSVQRFATAKEAEAALKQIADVAGMQAAAQYAVEMASSQSALIHSQTGAIHTFRTPDHAKEALDQLAAQVGKAAADNFNLVTRDTTALRICHFTPWVMLDDAPRESPDWRYPFIPFTVYQDTDNLADIKGHVRDTKDPQREVNWHHSTSLDILQRGPKGGVWVNKAEHVDINKIRNEYSKPGFVGEYVGQPPIPVIPQPQSQGEMDMIQFGIESIMRISGVNAEMAGATTQKTVSGRAIMSRQAGGLVGLGSMFLNWTETKTLIGQSLIRCIQQYYSIEKMDRIIGDAQRKMKAIGLSAPQDIPPDVMYDHFKRLKDVDMDIVVGFQEASPTARAAVGNQMMQLRAAGVPIPLQLIIEAMDIPFKDEIIASLAQQGEQQPNPELTKALSAGQGQTQPTGVNQA